MLSAASEVGGPETGDQADAVSAERVELGGQGRGRPLAVAARPGDLALIPAFQAGLVAPQNEADPTREAAALALGEVTKPFLPAPFSRPPNPAADVGAPPRELAVD